MRLREVSIICLLACICLTVYAGPARTSYSVYHQPDGLTFNVKISGDEWTRIRKTEDGCAIVKDIDGWWCYATYDTDGHISSTGHHVGMCVSPDVLDASRRIPYDLLAQKAQKKRNLGEDSRTRALKSMQQRTAMTKSSSGQNMVKGLAILVQFQDTKFKYTKEDFRKLLNEQGYNGTGSAKDYFSDQFGEGWDFTFDVSDIVTVDKLVKYYGANDQDDNDIRPAKLIRDACRLADASVDFSQYDLDNDGEVDNVYVFYAGEDEAINTEETDLLWAHQWYIYSGAGISLSCDGKRIDRYACSSELESRGMAGIGAFCHEFSHTFGLPDLYDTNYDEDGEDKWAAGVWRSTSLMDGGSYNNDSRTPPYYNCIERELLGLSSPVILEEGNTYTLEPIHKSGMFCRLETGTNGEYYLFECRSEEGWDRYIGGSGMLIYHIDKNATVRVDGYKVNRWDYNAVNDDPDHMCVDIIEADNRSHVIPPEIGLKIFQESISDIFFPLDAVTSMTPSSHPSYKFWNGQTPPLNITGIKRIGKNISFSVADATKETLVPSVENIGYTTFPDAAIIYFESGDPSLDAEPIVEWTETDGDTSPSIAEAVEYAHGKYACKISGIESSATYKAKIRFETKTSVGATATLPFMTKMAPPVSWPYIYIANNDTIDPVQGIVLHAVNSAGAREIQWEYNGNRIDLDADQVFRPTGNGTLKATVMWRDGSSDIIVKDLKVSK